MRLVGLLVVLAIIGLLIARQQGGVSPNYAGYDSEAPQPPRVPTQAQDVPAFEHDMNQFMSDSERLQKERIEQMNQ